MKRKASVPGTWAPLGGGAEPAGRRPHATGVRELNEEVGLQDIALSPMFSPDEPARTLAVRCVRLDDLARGGSWRLAGRLSGTAGSAVIRCRCRWRRKQRSVRVGAGHGRRRLTRQRVIAMRRGEQAECPVCGQSRTVGVERSKSACTARTAAGHGPAASGRRRGTVLRKRRSRMPRRHRQHRLFCRRVGSGRRVLRATRSGLC
ncbi:hypothetical protein [Streptomyces sp. NPDC055287]